MSDTVASTSWLILLMRSDPNARVLLVAVLAGRAVGDSTLPLAVVSAFCQQNAYEVRKRAILECHISVTYGP